MEEDVPIEHGLINRAIENAQKKVEGHNFDIRKNLLEYDDVMNQQRKTIYALRRQVLEGRYAPEPTEEEKKKGKTARRPTPRCRPSRASTPSQRSRRSSRPMLARMCDALTRGARRRSGRAPTRCHRSPTVAARSGAPALARSTAQFGAYLDTKGIARGSHRHARSAGRRGRLVADPAARARCSISARRCCSRSSTSTARPTRTPRTGTSRRCATRSRSASTSSPAIDEPGRSSARRWPRSLWAEVEKVIEARETEFALPVLLYFARHFYLEEIDERWIDHLKSMEALREGIGLRGYGQKDPKQEYKKEGFVIFGEMMGIIGRNVCEKLFHMQLQRARRRRRRRRGAAVAKPPTSVPMRSAAPRARRQSSRAAAPSRGARQRRRQWRR